MNNGTPNRQNLESLPFNELLYDMSARANLGEVFKNISHLDEGESSDSSSSDETSKNFIRACNEELEKYKSKLKIVVTPPEELESTLEVNKKDMIFDESIFCSDAESEVPARHVVQVSILPMEDLNLSPSGRENDLINNPMLGDKVIEVLAQSVESDNDEEQLGYNAEALSEKNRVSYETKKEEPIIVTSTDKLNEANSSQVKVKYSKGEPIKNTLTELQEKLAQSKSSFRERNSDTSCAKCEIC